MLKGDPGSGKTISLRKFGYELAKKSLNNINSFVRIPIYISLNSYTEYLEQNSPEPFFDFIQSYLKNEYPSADYIREHLSEYLIEGRITFLLDGLNELPQQEFLARYKLIEDFILRKFPKNKFLISCRSIRHTSIFKFETVEINELSEKQIEQFLINYKGKDNASTLFNELTSGDGFMLNICRNPYMLHMLVNRPENKSLPKTQAKLFEEYCFSKLSRFTNQPSKIVQQLSDIAFKMQVKDKFAGGIELKKIKANIDADYKENLIIAKNANLIDFLIDGEFRFYHQILQEYFASLILVETFNKSSKIEKIEDSKWEETILVGCGIIDNPTDFIKEIYQKSNNINLTIKAIGNSDIDTENSKFYKEIFNEAEEILHSYGNSNLIEKIEILKSLSYIEKESTLNLFSVVSIRYKGWLQELSLQLLCKSRHPLKLEKLEKTVIELKSVNTIYKLRSLIKSDKLIKFLIKSTITFDNLSKLFWNSLQYLFIFVPFVLFTLLFKISQKAGIHYYYIIGGGIALTWFIQFIIMHRKDIRALALNKDSISSKFRHIIDRLSWFHLIAIIATVSVILYPNIIFPLFSIILFVGFILFTAYDFYNLVIKIVKPKILISFLFNRKIYFYLFFIFIGTYIMDQYLPQLRSIPTGENLPDLQSNKISEILFSSYKYIFHPIVFIPWKTMLQVLCSLSFSVHLITYLGYLRIYVLKRKYFKKGDISHLNKIVKNIEKNNCFISIKVFSIKIIRKLPLPNQIILKLESINSNDDVVMTELERTLYEIKMENREQNRYK